MQKEDQLLAYLNAKSAYQSKTIPTKNKFTFLSKLTGMPQVWTLGEDEKPIQYGRLQDRVVSVHHSQDGDRSVIGMDKQGNEKEQLYLLEDDGSKIGVLVNEPDYFHHVGGWSPNGRYISFSSNRRHPGFFDVYIQDIQTKRLKKIFEYDGNCIPLSWLADGEHILVSVSETNIDKGIYILNINTGHTVRIGQDGVHARYQSINLSDDGKSGYLLTDLGEETLYLCRFSIDKPNQLEKLIHIPEWDIEEISLSPQEDTIALTLNEGGIFKLLLLDVHSNETLTIDNISKGVIDSLSWLNQDQLIFTLKTPTSPGDIWQYSISTAELKRLTYISQSDEVEKFWIEPKIYSFRSFDGLEVPYFYYEKEKDPNKPAVVYVHGGPEGQTRAVYDPVIQYLVDQGFAVAAPNVRGSRGYGRTYIKLDDARKRMDSVQDLAWLAKDLVHSHGVDDQKIGVMGRSYGGFMVLASVTHYPDVWAAGVNIVGISNIKTFLENTGEWRRKRREFEYGSLEHDADFFEEIAPLNHSHKITAPLLVFHGRNDTRVPVSEAEQLVSDMEGRGQTVELIVFEDEGHHTEKIDNHITMNSKIVEFFTKYLSEQKVKF